MDAIDLATFEDLKATAGTDFVRELADTFLAEAPAMLANLRDAFAANDAERFRRVAHSLKSNANTFGATTLAAIAKKIELDGLASVRAADGAALGEADREYVRVEQRLKELSRG